MERSVGAMGRRELDAADRPLHRALAWALAVLAILAIAVMWIRGAGVSRRSLRGMPEAERQALYQRTVQNLDAVCLPSARAGFESFCRSQAELVLRFPECGEGCAARYSPLLSRPTR